MSTLPQPYRIGGFNVHCFHSCTNAAAIHTELKKLHIDAAVVDHAFILSPLHLAVALFRVESHIDGLSLPATSSISSEKQQQQQQQQPSAPPQSTTPSATLAVSAGLPARRTSFSRRIFAALSLTHNLNRILQILPPGPRTSSVVIVYRSPVAPVPTPLTSPVCPVERRGDGVDGNNINTVSGDSLHAAEKEGWIEGSLQQVVHTTNASAVEHRFSSICEPFWNGTAVQHVEVGKVMEYYGVSETMLLAAHHSLTKGDVQRVCRTVDGDSEDAQRRALRWHALQLCVTTQLAACTA